MARVKEICGVVGTYVCAVKSSKSIVDFSGGLHTSVLLY